VSERARTWGGTPNRWTPTARDRTAWDPQPPGRGAQRAVEPDRAEPTDGRHAFDRDAALTPIFTALRRGHRRRPRTGAPPLRLAPEPVDRPWADPPTSPIPVVPALHALDPYPTGGYTPTSVDPYASRGYRWPAERRDTYAAVPDPPRVPPPSATETTAEWRLPADPMAYTPVTDTGRHHRRLAPAGW
jgi:hypothetical protein